MKTFLRSAGFATLAASFVFAQSTGPRFEVASVKPAPPDAVLTSMNGGPLPAGAFNQGDRNPERISWTNVRLERIIQVAYDMPFDRISGPSWIGTTGFTVVAAIPMGTTVADFRLMVQNLLAERFKLAVHRETKEVSGYALEIAKSGLKLKQSSPSPKEHSFHDVGSKPGEAKVSPTLSSLVAVDESGFPAPRPGNPYYGAGAGFEMTIAVSGRNRATVLNHSMPAIATFLSNVVQSPVQDQTGLTGIFDFHLEYAPGPATPDSEPAPGIFDAVQQQLGLKLTAKKVPVETLVIDHAERVPVDN